MDAKSSIEACLGPTRRSEMLTILFPKVSIGR